MRLLMIVGRHTSLTQFYFVVDGLANSLDLLRQTIVTCVLGSVQQRSDTTRSEEGSNQIK